MFAQGRHTGLPLREEKMFYCQRKDCTMMNPGTCKKRLAAMQRPIWMLGSIEADPGCIACGGKELQQIDDGGDMKESVIAPLAGDPAKASGPDARTEEKEWKYKVCGETKPMDGYYTNGNGNRDSTCRRCRLKQQSEKKKAKRRAAQTSEAALDSVGSESALPEALPPASGETRFYPAVVMEREIDHIYVDFKRYPDMLKRLRDAAEREFRTPEAQVLWHLSHEYSEDR